MSQFTVRYCAGFNTSGTGQHEVLEYVVKSDEEVHGVIEEGPYVVLYLEHSWSAEAIAALLNADGTDNNFPETPLAQAQHYMAVRFGKQDPGLVSTGE